METLEQRCMLSASPLVPEPLHTPPDGQQGPSDFIEGELIVGFKAGADNQQIEGVYGAHGLREREQLYGSDAVRRVSVPEATSSQVLQALQNNPLVEYAEPNFVATASFTPNDPYYSPYQWHLTNSKYGGIHAGEAWETTGGTGAVVAVLDTGVAYEDYSDSTGSYYVAPDLAETEFVSGYDFVNNDAHANDDHSHGTHVAGTIAQSTDNSLGAAGVAFDASIMPIKVLNQDGSGTYSGIAQGIKWSADNGAQVINMSLGGGSPSTTLEDALAYAHNKGVTIVAAAGNDGQNAVSYPAAYDDYVIAVSATRFDEQLADYSNYGSSIDLAAPGGDVNVDQNGDGYGDGVLQNTFDPNTQNTGDFGYYFFQGTSMATPHVAGVAALVASQGVTDPVQVRDILQSSAEDKGATGLDIYYGHGIVDAAAALASLEDTNTAPVAGDDSATTQEDSPVTINVLGNDSDDDGDSLSVDSVVQPANGSATINDDNTIAYTPNADYNGSDSFAYTISDGNGGSDTATVTITIDSVNDNPLAADDSGTTEENTAVTLDVLSNDSDVDGDALSVDSVGQPTSGSVTINDDNTLTYTPKTDFSGSDSFTYTIGDGNGGSDTATVTVDVTAANTAPVAVDDSTTTQEDSPVTISVLDNDSDDDGDSLSVDSVVQPANGRATINDDNTIAYTPNADYNGSDSFTYTISDGNGGSDTATVTITISSVNDAPVAADDSGTTEENTAVTLDVLSNDSDVDGDALSVDSVGQPTGGSVTINDDNTLTYTPDAGFTGSDSFTYTVDDGNGGSDTATVTVDVTAADTAHVGDLDSSVHVKGKSGKWEAFVTVAVHDSGGQAIGDATVTGTWSGDTSGAVSGTTGSDGTVTLGTGDIRGGNSVTFTVDDVSGSFTYDPTANHDPDGDSNGTSITVNKDSSASGSFTLFNEGTNFDTDAEENADRQHNALASVDSSQLTEEPLAPQPAGAPFMAPSPISREFADRALFELWSGHADEEDEVTELLATLAADGLM